jgi:predicted HNH restriction endonuclease
MKFGKAQQKRFGTLQGAYSVVTHRENEDSQITLTDHEADLVISHFGRSNLLVGNVASNKTKASKNLRLFPTGERVQLNVIFPKPEKSELRLYLTSRAGFKPEGGEVWFIYKVKSDLWIGSMSETEWRTESSALKEDQDDSFYQESLDEADPARIVKLAERDVFKRDRRIALKRMRLSGYVCEYDEKHKLFTSRFSGMPYLEAHHLIPISLQTEYRNTLDTVHNVFCLCPFCHRAVHHADAAQARRILRKLSSRRSVLDRYSLDLPGLLSCYGVEKID